MDYSNLSTEQLNKLLEKEFSDEAYYKNGESWQPIMRIAMMESRAKIEAIFKIIGERRIKKKLGCKKGS